MEIKEDVDVEVKGTLEDNGRHLELGLSREFEAGAPHVHPKKPSEYYRVNDERVLIECKKKNTTRTTFRFLCPEVILGETQGRRCELGDP